MRSATCHLGLTLLGSRAAQGAPRAERHGDAVQKRTPPGRYRKRGRQGSTLSDGLSCTLQEHLLVHTLSFV